MLFFKPLFGAMKNMENKYPKQASRIAKDGIFQASVSVGTRCCLVATQTLASKKRRIQECIAEFALRVILVKQVLKIAQLIVPGLHMTG